jgi:hypothetical protein
MDDIDQPYKTIEINDDSNDDNDTQSSMDQYAESRRSSIDSAISNVPLQQQLQRSNRAPLHRLSAGIYQSSSLIYSQKNVSEHLLLGYVQVIGQFAYDPVLLNSNVFAPLKSKTMYYPFGRSSIGGGGGGMMLAHSDPSSAFRKGIYIYINKWTFT